MCRKCEPLPQASIPTLTPHNAPPGESALELIGMVTVLIGMAERSAYKTTIASVDDPNRVLWALVVTDSQRLPVCPYLEYEDHNWLVICLGKNRSNDLIVYAVACSCDHDAFSDAAD